MKLDRYSAMVEGFRPNVIVHVGASVAQELERYEALAPRRVVWIEASPPVFAELGRRVVARASGRVEHTCVQALVTDRDGEAVTFNHFSNGDASSSIFRSTEKLRETWPDVHETGQTSLLTTSRLDTLLAGLGVRPEEVDLLTFDIQGAELLGLRGAGAYLDHVSFLEVEASVESIYDGAPLFPEVDALVTSKGFVRLSKVLWHGDVVYVRASRLDQQPWTPLRPIADFRQAGGDAAK